MGRWGSKVLNFLVKKPIQLFLLQTSRNVLKHILHKWGGHIWPFHDDLRPQFFFDLNTLPAKTRFFSIFGALKHHEMARYDLPTYVLHVLGHFWMFAVKITEWLFSLKSLGLWTHLWTHLPIVWDKVPNKSVFFHLPLGGMQELDENADRLQNVWLAVWRSAQSFCRRTAQVLKFWS